MSDKSSSLLEEFAGLLRPENLDEKSAHAPFKNKKKLGPGPKGRSMSQAKKWSCECPSKYKCKCKGLKGKDKGKVKVVKIDKAAKAKYNPLYRKWRSKKKKAELKKLAGKKK